MSLSDLGFSFKEKYDINDLTSIVNILRSNIGCPWDREQDHKSIRMDFLEETYEVLEAIDNDDTELLREELGDVLLQVVFHSQIENEQDHFSFSDVVNEICKKLILRHPHVFEDVKADNTEDVLKNWDNIKKESKNQETYTDTLTSIPSVFPALMKSQKIAKRSERAGFKIPNVNLHELLNDYENSLSSDNSEKIESSLGKLLFYITSSSTNKGISSEESLEKECNRFVLFFGIMENLIRLDGKNISSLSINELSDYWSMAQKQKKQ